MFNFIKSRLPHPSLRFFLFVLFGLVILGLIAEGGYFYLTQRKKAAITDWVNLIEGQINEIDGRTLIITAEDNSLIPQKIEIEIEVDSDAFIFTGEELEEIRPILFTDLKVGDTIQAGFLTKLTERKFKAESISLE